MAHGGRICSKLVLFKADRLCTTSTSKANTKRNRYPQRVVQMNYLQYKTTLQRYFKKVEVVGIVIVKSGYTFC